MTFASSSATCIMRKAIRSSKAILTFFYKSQLMISIILTVITYKRSFVNESHSSIFTVSMLFQFRKGVLINIWGQWMLIASLPILAICVIQHWVSNLSQFPVPSLYNSGHVIQSMWFSPMRFPCQFRTNTEQRLLIVLDYSAWTRYCRIPELGALPRMEMERPSRLVIWKMSASPRFQDLNIL